MIHGRNGYLICKYNNAIYDTFTFVLMYLYYTNKEVIVYSALKTHLELYMFKHNNTKW